MGISQIIEHISIETYWNPWSWGTPTPILGNPWKSPYVTHSGTLVNIQNQDLGIGQKQSKTMVICPPLRTETNAAGDPALCSESDTKAACRPSNRLPFAVPHLNPPKRNTTWIDCNLQLTLIQIHEYIYIYIFMILLHLDRASCRRKHDVIVFLYSNSLKVFGCRRAFRGISLCCCCVAEAMNQMRQQNPGRDSFYVDALGFIIKWIPYLLPPNPPTLLLFPERLAFETNIVCNPLGNSSLLSWKWKVKNSF